MANNMGEFTVSDKDLNIFLKTLFPNKTSYEIEEMLKNPILRKTYVSQYEDAYKYGLDPNAIANQAAERLSKQNDPKLAAAANRNRIHELKSQIEKYAPLVDGLRKYIEQNGGRGRK